MIIEVDQSLLDAPLQAIGHFCNCQCVMGGGIALRIREVYPEAYQSDCKTKQGDPSKLGTFSYAIAKDGKWIINCYTQFRYGYASRNTNYEAVYNSLTKVRNFLEENKISKFGIPKNAGCRLGGGSWIVVRAIIEDIFGGDCPIELTICNYD